MYLSQIGDGDSYDDDYFDRLLANSDDDSNESEDDDAYDVLD
jgi:hypothetical protein